MKLKRVLVSELKAGDYYLKSIDAGEKLTVVAEKEIRENGCLVIERTSGNYIYGTVIPNNQVVYRLENEKD